MSLNPILDKGNQILCLATTPFEHPFTRKQQVMTRLKDCRIAYVNPPVTLIAPLKDKEMHWERLSCYHPEGYPNITVWHLPPILPFYYKMRGINRFNMQMLILPWLRKICLAESFSAPVVWTYSPMYADVVKYINKDALVYDCVDRHSAYSGHLSPKLVDRMEEDLCRRCDAVFSTAKGLHERLSQFSDFAHFIPNGVDCELFGRAMDPQDPPAELADITGPVFGFVGHIRNWVDLGLITTLADEHPEATVVLVGPKGPDITIPERKNIRWLGPKPQKELPAFISRFDVCLNPFADSALTADVSPLKFYEYLATGKPIVSTRNPAQVAEFADVSYVARDARDFLDGCKAALQPRSEAQIAAQLARARTCSWDGRVADIRTRLAEKDILTAKDLPDEENE